MSFTKDHIFCMSILDHKRRTQMPRPLMDRSQDDYVRLNFTVAIIGLIFPIVLWAGGRLAGFDLRSSMSAYYWATNDAPCTCLIHKTDAEGDACQKEFPVGEDLKACLTGSPLDIAGTMRNYFVGFLFAVGATLYLNKGYSFKEDIALNITAVSAVLIALFPMPWSGSISKLYWVHGTATTMFFASIAFVSGFCSRDTVSLIASVTQRKIYTTIYSVLAILMIGAPIGVYVTPKNNSIYWVEFSGIWSFGAYWIVKGIEMSGHVTEKLVRTDVRYVPSRLSLSSVAAAILPTKLSDIAGSPDRAIPAEHVATEKTVVAI